MKRISLAAIIFIFLGVPVAFSSGASRISGINASAESFLSDPSNCTSGEAAAGIASDGSAQGCFDPSSPGASAPAGTILAFAGSSAPSGFLICDGASVSQTTYADLYAVIGTTYGDPGGGNFNLPNLKGRVPVGFDSSQTEFDVLGEVGGEKTHQLTTDEMPSHSHSGGAVSAAVRAATSGPIGITTSTTGNAGGDQAHNNLQPYLTIKYIIKT